MGGRPGGFGAPPPGGFGFGFGPRPRRRGIGCGTTLLVPLFILMFALYLFAGSFGTGTQGDAITSGSRTYTYSEEDFQEFADREYQRAFGNTDNYEGNILLAVLTNDQADDYFALAWVGDDIDPEIREMFGGSTELGNAMNRYVNGTYYAYSLDSDLAAVVKTMSTQVSGISNGIVTSNGTSYLENYTKLDLTTQTVDASLEEFQQETGIPMVIVVESLEEVFPVKLAFGSIFTSGILPVVLVAVVIAGAVLVKKKSGKNQESE